MTKTHEFFVAIVKTTDAARWLARTKLAGGERSLASPTGTTGFTEEVRWSLRKAA